jgi:hypothetical protein
MIASPECGCRVSRWRCGISTGDLQNSGYVTLLCFTDKSMCSIIWGGQKWNLLKNVLFRKPTYEDLRILLMLIFGISMADKLQPSSFIKKAIG